MRKLPLSPKPTLTCCNDTAWHGMASGSPWLCGGVALAVALAVGPGMLRRRLEYPTPHRPPWNLWHASALRGFSQICSLAGVNVGAVCVRHIPRESGLVPRSCYLSLSVSASPPSLPCFVSVFLSLFVSLLLFPTKLSFQPNPSSPDPLLFVCYSRTCLRGQSETLPLCYRRGAETGRRGTNRDGSEG